jgi:hypothetical protein
MDFKGKITNNRIDIYNHHLISPMLSNLEGKEIEITVKRFKKSRSAAQNRWYWGIAIAGTLIPQLKNMTGEDFTKEELHQLHLTACIKCKFSTRDILGKTVIMYDDISTKKMTTVEFNSFKDKVQKFWAEKGIDIPDPNEENYLNEIK